MPIAPHGDLEIVLVRVFHHLDDVFDRAWLQDGQRLAADVIAVIRGKSLDGGIVSSQGSIQRR